MANQQHLRRPAYHVGVGTMCTGVSLVGSIQRRELYRVTDKKHRLFFTQYQGKRKLASKRPYGVVEDPVQIALISVQLHCPAVHITYSVC